jgi:hypothetical protein
MSLSALPSEGQTHPAPDRYRIFATTCPFYGDAPRGLHATVNSGAPVDLAAFDAAIRPSQTGGRTGKINGTQGCRTKPPAGPWKRALLGAAGPAGGGL